MGFAQSSAQNKRHERVGRMEENCYSQAWRKTKPKTPSAYAQLMLHHFSCNARSGVECCCWNFSKLSPPEHVLNISTCDVRRAKLARRKTSLKRERERKKKKEYFPSGARHVRTLALPHEFPLASSGLY